MFQLPSYLSILLDASLVIVYFDDPEVVDDSIDIMSNSWDPLKSFLLLAFCAGTFCEMIRIILLYNAACQVSEFCFICRIFGASNKT